ncbi:MAG: restriction endonuclease subunit S [Sulfurovum sp.]|nr:MAG: restriction endonuclease subunit S [Sulfurovum sp.]
MHLELKLGEISNFINGGAWSDTEYVDSGYKVVKVTNMINGSIASRNDNFLSKKSYQKYQKHILYENDLIVATVGSHPSQKGSVVGRTSIVPKEFHTALLNQNAVCIRITDKRICQTFFNYLTKTILFKHHIESRAQGSANQVRMALGELKKFSFLYPPLNTQQKIASLLSNYDKLIENNSQRIKLLESMAEEMYKEWFVRLRFPGYKNVEVVDGLPVGWERDKLSKYLKYHRGKSYSSEDIAGDTGLPFINLKCINRNGGFRRDGIKVFNGEYKETNVAYEGDIVMAVTDMTQDRAIVGRVAKVPAMNQDKYIVSMDLVKIEPLNIEKDFLYALLRFSTIGLLLKEFANGVNVLHLTPDMIYLQKVITPPKNLQIKFEKILVPILKEIDILNLKNDELREIRDLLLPRLMSGKLKVEDLDII